MKENELKKLKNEFGELDKLVTQLTEGTNQTILFHILGYVCIYYIPTANCNF